MYCQAVESSFVVHWVSRTSLVVPYLCIDFASINADPGFLWSSDTSLCLCICVVSTVSWHPDMAQHLVKGV